MLVYVAIGPEDFAICKFFSSTMVDKFWAACAMFECTAFPAVGRGVAAPVPIVEVGGSGVESPLLSWVTITDASFRDASEIICFMFLFRRCEGFQT